MKRLIIISGLMLISCAEIKNNPILVNFTRLTQTVYLVPIDICNGGGTIETSGLDENKNEILEDEEVDVINVTCDVPLNDGDDDYEDGDFNCHKHNHGHNCKKDKK